MFHVHYSILFFSFNQNYNHSTLLCHANYGITNYLLVIQNKDSIKTDEEIQRSEHSRLTTRMFVTPISLQTKWFLYTTCLTTKHMMIPLYHPFKTKNQKNYRSRTSPFTRKDTITIPSHKPFCLKIRTKKNGSVCPVA